MIEEFLLLLRTIQPNDDCEVAEEMIETDFNVLACVTAPCEGDRREPKATLCTAPIAGDRRPVPTSFPRAGDTFRILSRSFGRRAQNERRLSKRRNAVR